MSEPSYFAVIPAPVRYHQSISANAKLLYGEISALCNKEGFCWSTNEYFSKLYNVGQTTISEWVSSLRKAGFVRIEIDQSRGNERKIYLVGGLPEIPRRSSGKAEEGSSGKAESSIRENGTRVNREAKPPARSAGKPLELKLEIEPSTPALFALKQIPEFESAFSEFVESRKKKRKPLTPRAKLTILKRLSERPDQAMIALDAMLEFGWDSFDWNWDSLKARLNGKTANLQSLDKTAELEKDFRDFIAGHSNEKIRARYLTPYAKLPSSDFIHGEFNRFRRTGKYDSQGVAA